jgi:drug/metabolite transporter (DMT)-like permease
LSRGPRFLAYVAFGIVCFVWGTTYVAIAIANETLPVLLFPGARFTIAGLLLLAVAWLLGKPFPKKRIDWVYSALVGALMTTGNFCVVWSEHHVSSGFAALLVGSSPFWMAILERFRKGGVRFGARRIAGLVIGFTGLAILVGPEVSGNEFNAYFLGGVFAIQVGSIAWNQGSIISKYKISKDLDPMMSAALQMLFGGLIIGAVGLLRGEAAQFSFTQRSLLAFLYLVFFGSILTYGAYVYALSQLPTSTTSLYAYINPVVAVFLGWAMLNEPIGWNAIAGMLVIFTGVAFVQATSFRVASKATQSAKADQTA